MIGFSLREIRELGYAGAYTAVKRFLAAIRPESGPKHYEVRFETPPIGSVWLLSKLVAGGAVPTIVRF